MDSDASSSGAWAESDLTFLLGCFQGFWTLGTNTGGAVRSLGLDSTTPRPDPEPSPKKASAKCFCNT